MTTFGDDEQIFGSEIDTTGLEDEYTVGKAKLKIINAATTALEESNFRVLLELTGLGNAKERLGLDLVIVLDISESMSRPDRFQKLKKATKFVIKTLSPLDRVSVVTFSNVATRLCGLRQISEDSRVDIVNLVNGMIASDEPNISEGLKMALQVLRDRKFTQGRSVGIILMSNGAQNRGGNAAEVKVGNVPVYTFGFGTNIKNLLRMPNVLEAIARNSNGGTFSNVQYTNDFRLAFSQCFAGLLTLAVRGLKFVISPENGSIIENVSAGDYEQCWDDSSNVYVSFGNLYDKETHKVIVDLLLRPVTKEVSAQVLKASYRYRNTQGTKELKSPPIFASTKRIGNVTEEDKEEVVVEVSRNKTVPMMKQARVLIG